MSQKNEEQFIFIFTPRCHMEQFWGAIHPIATQFLLLIIMNAG
jgi:hypothetical protein